MDNKTIILRLLGNMLDSEIDSGETPDMDFVRECVSRIEEYFPKLTKSDLEAILIEIIEENRSKKESRK